MHPNLVRNLVLVDPAVPTRGAAVRPRLDRSRGPSSLPRSCRSGGSGDLSRAVAALGPESLVHETLRLCSADPSRIEQAVVDAHIALEAERLAQPGWQESFYAATRSLVRVLALKRQVVRWIQEVVAPTLLVQGDHDRLVSVDSARWVASLRPDWEYHEFAGAGHIPMLEVPAEFLEVTLDWLARHETVVALGLGRSRPGRAVGARRSLLSGPMRG